MWTPEQDAAADRIADAVVKVAVAHHPGDPAAQAECALVLAGSLMADPRPIVSVESPSMTPADLELRLSSPGVKWSRHPWRPRTV